MDRVRLLDGYQIPAAMSVMVNAWAIGRDPGVWGEDAHTFRPDKLGVHLKLHILLLVGRIYKMFYTKNSKFGHVDTKRLQRYVVEDTYISI